MVIHGNEYVMGLVEDLSGWVLVGDLSGCMAYV